MQLFLVNENSEKRKIFIPNDPMNFKESGGGVKRALQGGKIITLGVAETGQLEIGRAYASVSQVTAACYAVSRTIFNEVSPKPDWYDSLNTKFLTVKSYTDKWLRDYSVAVASTIPTSIITYMPVFNTIMASVKEIAQKYVSGVKISDNDKNTLDLLVKRLMDETKSVYDKVSLYSRIENGASKGLLIDWMSGLNDAITDLDKGAINIQSAQKDLTDKIVELNKSIQSMNDQIATYERNVSIGAGLVGGGAFVGVAGGAVCFLNPIVGGILITVGVLAILGGSVTWGIFQDKINALSATISQYKRTISEDKLAIIALKGLETNMNRVSKNATYAVDQMQSFAETWMDLFGALDKMRENVSKIGTDGDTSLWSVLTTDINAATECWNMANQYAEEIMETPHDTKEIPA